MKMPVLLCLGILAVSCLAGCATGESGHADTRKRYDRDGYPNFGPARPWHVERKVMR